MWSWAHEDRTELLEAFAHADTVTEYTFKRQANQKAKPNKKFVTYDNQLPMASVFTKYMYSFCCLHKHFHALFPASFLKSPLKSSISEVCFQVHFIIFVKMNG